MFDSLLQTGALRSISVGSAELNITVIGYARMTCFWRAALASLLLH